MLKQTVREVMFKWCIKVGQVKSNQHQGLHVCKHLNYDYIEIVLKPYEHQYLQSTDRVVVTKCIIEIFRV